MLRLVVVSVCLSLCLVNAAGETLLFKPKGAVSDPPNPLCPDKHGTCPTSSTCCLMASGKYGCCPLPNAQCCSDKVHCCPHGYTCDVAKGECNSGDIKFPWVTKVKAMPGDEPPKKVVLCPGKKVYCPAHASCCKLKNGAYGCCPLPRAVCCEDGVHCCPLGYTCDTAKASCDKPRGVTNSWIPLTSVAKQTNPEKAKSRQAFHGLRVPAKQAPIPNLEPTDVVCLGGQFKCQNKQACCPLEGGSFGCCPYTSGVCCGDQKHCCPLDYICDNQQGKCVKTDGKFRIPLGVPRAAISTKPEPEEESIFQYLLSLLLDHLVDFDQEDDDDNDFSPQRGPRKGGKKTKPKFASKTDKGKVPQSNKSTSKSAPTKQAGKTTTPAGLGSGQKSSSQPVKTNVAAGMVKGQTNKPLKTKPVSGGQAKPSKSVPLPPPKNPVKIDVKRVTEPQTSTRVDDRERASMHPPPKVPTISTFKRPAVKPVLKTPSKPPKKVPVTPPIPRKQLPVRTAKKTPPQHQPNEKPPLVRAKIQQNLKTGSKGAKVGSSGEANTSGPKQGAAVKKTTPQPQIRRQPVVKLTGNPVLSEAIQQLRWGDRDAKKPHKKTLPEQMVFAGERPEKGKDLKSSGSGSPAVARIHCPDKQSSCPNNSTCCQMLSGQYGCCPLAKAVCCSDHLHCCPSGYTCNVAAGTCEHGADSQAWFSKQPATPHVSHTPDDAGKGVVCPDKSSCPLDTTCCQMLSGGYGCCPFAKAHCCTDHLHCCPSDQKCDVAQGSCQSANQESQPWQAKFPASPAPSSGHPLSSKLLASNFNEVYKATVEADVVCPDGKSTCPQGSTCCKMLSGYYGCCPYPKAVCCSDHLHCCPALKKCDVARGTCQSANGDARPWQAKFPAKSLTSVEEPLTSGPICPGGKYKCPMGTTCCSLGGGTFGCCPQPQAVCCSDHLHCCPNGETCNVAQGTCVKDGVSTPWMPKLPAESLTSVEDPLTSGPICPGGKYKCPTGATCCSLGGGKFGCCPMTQAVCCSDHLHCCPNGETCNVAQGTCLKEGVSHPWISKFPAESLTSVEEPLTSGPICPGGQYKCPTGATCCSLGSGTFGCCPMPQAVCCSDHLHCCPNGETCNVAQGTCLKDGVSQPWISKFPAESLTSVEEPLTSGPICPGGQYKCPTGATCCSLGGGKFGCCPMLQAVCCSDHLHCCPNGETCNVAQGTCVKEGVSTPWMPKLPAESLTSVEEPLTSGPICPGGQYKCPTGATCCSLGGGKFGCCPMTQAVCCSDHLHCCPNGETCNVAQGTCLKEGVSHPWISKFPAESLTFVEEPLTSGPICPGGQYKCPTGATCCSLGSGTFGCCPMPQAVCCSDHLHCCPNGETCNVAQGTCLKDGVSQPWISKFPAESLTSVEEPLTSGPICPGGQYKCPTGATCCSLGGGKFGCCPMLQAVCCSDHLHCCPNGETCNVAQGTCLKDGVSQPWISKFPAESLTSVEEPLTSGPICPGGQYKCPTGATCCSLGGGKFGCCPMLQAVCCSDHLHCCPNGETCNVAQGTCVKEGVSQPWISKFPAESLTSVEEPLTSGPICPGGKYKCPTRTTCCSLGGGKYGCCPIEQAVCCPDHVHCCPQGDTCNLSARTCESGSGDGSSIPWLQKFPAEPVLAPLPDATEQLVGKQVRCPNFSYCPENYTCCGSGEDTKCCPLPKAVCCTDKIHCCPTNYKCGPKNTTCSKAGSPDLPMSVKQPTLALKPETTAAAAAAAAAAAPNAVVCPGGRAECPSKQTCCKLHSGMWGCCPIPEAVCCDDGLHCCPSGSTCKGAQGICQSSENSLAVGWYQVRRTLRFVEMPPEAEAAAAAAGGGVGVDRFTITCKDHTECPNNTTCCSMKSGQYGCCPMPDAHCCKDKVHCCPKSFRCDATSTQCIKEDSPTTTIDAYMFGRHRAVLPAGKVADNDVICPDKTKCQDSTTCCKTTSGSYSCCPIPNAVCCGNGRCCPQGFACDPSSGTCTQSVPWLLKVPAKPRSPPAAGQLGAVICPDREHECPDGSTCCKLATQGWGCCPLPKATCCSDHVHCCPQGYTCDAQQAKCLRGDDSPISWLTAFQGQR